MKNIFKFCKNVEKIIKKDVECKECREFELCFHEFAVEKAGWEKLSLVVLNLIKP
jgi:hypothetical protein